MRRLALALMLVSFGACGPRYIWVKNVSQDELNRDRYECERDARQAVLSFGTGIVGQLNAQEFIGRCFQAKGYTLQPVAAGGGVTYHEGPSTPCEPAGPEDCLKTADGEIIKCPKCKFLTGP